MIREHLNPMNELARAFELELNVVLPLSRIRCGSRWPEPSMNFLIAYDIADPKRLSRVAKSH